MKLMAFTIALGLALDTATAWALTPKDVYKKAGPAVVLLLGSDDGKSGSGGTGSIVTPEGKVLTNAHVVLNERNEPFKTLYVFLKPPKITGDNGKDLANRYKARVVAYSVADELDLAIVQIENPPPNLPTIAFGDPAEVEIGDEAIAIGHPEQGGLWTLTTGTVSTVISNFGRVKGKDVFQTEASVNRGNSGGPLLDDEGNMIGVNTSIARQGAGGVAITGVNFSLKSSVAVKWLASRGMGLAYAPKGLEQPVVVAMAPEAPRAATRPAAAAEPPVPPAREENTMTVASAEEEARAPEVKKPPEVAKPQPPVAQAKPAAETKPAQAAPAEAKPAEQPRETIVIAEPPPKQDQVAKVREEGKALGKAKGKEKVTGKPVDPKKAKPKYHTEQRAYSLDDLRRQQMKELEDMMDEMSGKTRGKKARGGDGMGLW